MNLEDELNACMDEKKAISKKRGRLMIYDSIATSAGVMSVCALPISLVALIPLGASIGLEAYVNIKDKETYNQMRIINSKCSALEKEIKYNQRVKKR
ncbi:MAG: hypothetical protein IKG40_00215 [Bacilli bacterium]|nr:hypothetical protein [Bacilli bacterium]